MIKNIFFEYHIARNCQIYCLNKLKKREFYQFHIGDNSLKATVQDSYGKNINLKTHNVILDFTTRMFQYKIPQYSFFK